MSLHPFERFLGVSPDADPVELLGLARERIEALAIEEALRQRLGSIYRHPDGHSADAEVVRAALRESAAALKNQLRAQRQSDAAQAADTPAWMEQAVRSRNRPRHAPPTIFNLTAFDRMVLSVLVACGGWNRRSREQLVAVAQQYGVTVQGLMRVMEGLSAYARAGGPRIGVTDIAGRATSMPLAPIEAAAPPSVGVALLDRLADNLGYELKRGGAWPTIKLAIIFGVATIVVAIVVLRSILTQRNDSAANNQQIPAQTQPAIPQSQASRATQGAATSSMHIARFSETPTFLGNGLPAEAVNAVDHLPELPAQIDELGRKIAVANGEPSEAVYRQWDADMNAIALAWAMGDASTRSAVDKAIFEAMRAAGDTPAVSDRLLKTIVPPASVASPVDLLRGTWMAGTMARLASSSNVPPVVADRARSQLEIALAQNLRGTITFESAGDSWLSQRLPQLVQMLPVSEAAYDTWELWLTAERALGPGERHDAAVVKALNLILETDYDLATPGPAVNVAARLMMLAVQSGSPVSRQRMLDLFDDEDVASRDLWVLTSLLTTADKATWFPDRLVVPDDADMTHRWRIRDDLAKAWPVVDASASQPDARVLWPKIDLMESERWASLTAGALQAPPGADQQTLMQQIIDSSRLTEAAMALLGQLPEETRRIVKQVEDGWIATPPAKSAARPGLGTGAGSGAGGASRPGQVIGVDGAWAAQYEALGKNAEARAESIRSLRNTAGTDLGPIDAALLVREAYRGSPQEVRSVAQAVIQQQFNFGPIVAMQMLDQFPDAPAVDSISELIQAVTDRLLPGIRTSAWIAEARLALVQHALHLRDLGGVPVDGLLEPLIQSYAGRWSLARNDPSVVSMPTSPQQAAEVLLRTLTTQAEFAAPADPTPADLPNLQRRHTTRRTLADGPIQTFVAQQLAILDVTIYVMVAEHPALRDRALEIMREHATARMRTSDVLVQALDVERCVLELWRLRLGLDPQFNAEEGAAGT